MTTADIKIETGKNSDIINYCKILFKALFPRHVFFPKMLPHRSADEYVSAIV